MEDSTSKRESFFIENLVKNQHAKWNLEFENKNLKHQCHSLDQKIKELRAQNYRLAGILLRYKDYIEEGMNQVFIEKLVNKYSSKQSLAIIKAEAIKEAVSKLERPDVPLAPVFILNTDLLEYADNLLKGEGHE